MANNEQASILGSKFYLITILYIYIYIWPQVNLQIFLIALDISCLVIGVEYNLDHVFADELGKKCWPLPIK